MIAAVSWVPPGVVKSNPTEYEPEGEDLESLQQQSDAMKESVMHDAAADEIAKEYDLDNYDSDENGEAPPTGVFMPMHELDEIMENGEEDDEDPEDSDIEDTTIQPTDSLILAARAEGDESVLEINVFDSKHATMYVHHDILLPELPLCATWITHNNRNMVAVGTFQPQIELYDLDVLNAPPVSTLKGNTDSVMCFSWLMTTPGVLVNGCADKFIRGWDLTREACVVELQNHDDKVQSVALCPAEPMVCASGGFDKKVVVCDVRAPAAKIGWEVSADVEQVIWNPNSPQYVLTATEDGNVACHDARNSKQLFLLRAHDKACSGLTFTSGSPSFLTTCSPDKTVALWDVTNPTSGVPLIKRKKLDVGALLSVQPHPTQPLLVGLGSAKGMVAVWDASSDPTVMRHAQSLLTGQ